jgi:hypothetical protein
LRQSSAPQLAPLILLDDGFRPIDLPVRNTLVVLGIPILAEPIAMDDLLAAVAQAHERLKKPTLRELVCAWSAGRREDSGVGAAGQGELGTGAVTITGSSEGCGLVIVITSFGEFVATIMQDAARGGTCGRRRPTDLARALHIVMSNLPTTVNL